jgi:integrase
MLLEIRKYRGINRWHYDFKFKNHRYRGWLLPIDTMTKRQALAEITVIKSKLITEGEGYNPCAKKMDVKVIFDTYEEYFKQHKPATYERQKYMFSRFKFFHGKEAITHADIMNYQKKRLSGGRRWGKGVVKGATVNRELQVCRAAFNRAKRNKIWKGDNPFEFFDKYPEQERDRFLSKGELNALLKSCVKWDTDYEKRYSGKFYRGYMYDIVMMAILTGRRKQEILKLHRSSIDRESWTIIKKKTGSNKYKTDVITPVAPVLRQMIDERIKRSISGYLFENPVTGKPFNGIKKAWQSVLKDAGIEDFRFHDNRHTFGTYANLASNDLKGVSETIGHSSVAQTSKYVHTTSKRKIEIINLVNDLISAMIEEK